MFVGLSQVLDFAHEINKQGGDVRHKQADGHGHQYDAEKLFEYIDAA